LVIKTRVYTTRNSLVKQFLAKKQGCQSFPETPRQLLFCKLNPRLGLRLNGGAGRFLEMHLPARCILPNLLTHVEPCRDVLFEQAPSLRRSTKHREHPLRHFRFCYGVRMQRACTCVRVYTHVYAHRRRSRCIVVDFESRSIKPHRRARAHVLHQIFHAV